jgi:hypothetical protein
MRSCRPRAARTPDSAAPLRLALSVVLTAAAELQSIQLDDALEILILMAAEKDPRFDRAAARWVGGLPAETPIGLR